MSAIDAVRRNLDRHLHYIMESEPIDTECLAAAILELDERLKAVEGPVHAPPPQVLDKDWFGCGTFEAFQAALADRLWEKARASKINDAQGDCSMPPTKEPT